MDLRKWGVIVLLITVIAACSSGGGGSSGTNTSSGGSGTGAGNGTGTGSGSLTLNLTDSPFSDAKSVLVSFSEIQVHRSGGTWESMPIGSTITCDLKKLVGSQFVLGTKTLPAGHYTMIRVVVTQSALYFNNQVAGPACFSAPMPPLGPNDAQLEIPSGEIKLNREFDITAGKLTTILLDFKGDQSIHKTGNDRYMMNPVIGIVSVQS